MKLETKLSDDGWQTVLNFLNLRKSGVLKLSFMTFALIKCMVEFLSTFLLDAQAHSYLKS